MEKDKNSLANIEKLYSENLQSFGCSPKSVGWRDEKSHLLRFEKLSQVFSGSDEKQTIIVNDWGCGYGAMFKYLDSLSAVHVKKYYGYDISKEMLKAADRYICDDRAEWINSIEVKSKADYSFISGTFNVRFENSNDMWTQYIMETLLKLSAMTNRGLAFNLLSTYVDWKEKHLYYGDPLLFFDFCKKNISSYVSLVHDYPLYEWTILVRTE